MLWNQILSLEIIELQHKIDELANTIKHLKGQNSKLENQLKVVNQQYQAKCNVGKHNVFGKILRKLI